MRQMFSYLVNKVGVGRGVLLACKKNIAKETSVSQAQSTIICSTLRVNFSRAIDKLENRSFFRSPTLSEFTMKRLVVSNIETTISLERGRSSFVEVTSVHN